jgi:polyferredoxin
LRNVRYVLLVAVVLSLVAGRGLAPDWQEPFSAFRWAAAGWPARIIAILALLAAVLGIHRPWCSYFCSTGALLDAIRKTPKKKG